MLDVGQKEEMRRTLLELKIKKADLSKMALDFDMKELTGEITNEDLEEKKGKINLLIDKIINKFKNYKSF